MTVEPELSARSRTLAKVRLLCVVGAGTMGAQIAQVAALHGYTVNLYDPSRAALEKAVAGNRNQLESRVQKGKLTSQEAEEALSRVHPTTSLEEAAGTADFVIETVYDDLEQKRRLFRRLDNICPGHTILASNSSTLVISRIASDIVRKDKAINMHFFHPALVMQLVEVVRGPDTSDETVETAVALGHCLGKEVVVMQKEIFGFIVNHNNSYQEMDAAIRQKPAAFNREEDWDRQLRSGLMFVDGHVAPDLSRHLPPALTRDSLDPHDRPPTFLEELVVEGRLGRRVMRGY